MVMTITVDVHEPDFFNENIKDAKSRPLSVGDFLIEVEGKGTIVVERKTWDDAYNSWKSKRLEDQVSRMVEKYDDYVLIIEGNKSGSRLFRTKKFNLLDGLQTFLNRMSLEVLPVIYTSSKKKTASYLESLHGRVESGDYCFLVRKTTIVKSSRNVYHNIMSLIPGITIERSKELYAHFQSLRDFVVNTQFATELHPENNRWKTNVAKLEAFMNQEWGENREREVIKKVQIEKRLNTSNHESESHESNE